MALDGPWSPFNLGIGGASPNPPACAKAARCVGLSEGIVLVELGSDHCQRRRHHTCTSRREEPVFFSPKCLGLIPKYPEAVPSLHPKLRRLGGKCTGPAHLANSLCSYPSLRFNRVLESKDRIGPGLQGFRQNPRRLFVLYHTGNLEHMAGSFLSS